MNVHDIDPTLLLGLADASSAPVLPAPTGFRAGTVSLVGAGPGDPELLTLRAIRRIAAADDIVHDHLVADDVLRLARRDAVLHYVGKERDRHTLPQSGINALLARLAGEGRRVVRLKGGDPFLFGRGGEEMLHLAGCGVPVEVVPGITAAIGAGAVAGIPLTHRDHAQSCVFVTGHRKDGTCTLDWGALARPAQTVVFYMGLARLPDIVSGLVGEGLAASTPAAAIERATLPGGRTVFGTLADLGERVAAARLDAPTLIVVGSVVTIGAERAAALAAVPASAASVAAA